MHTIKTFILRLWVDTQQPETLRGALQAVSEEQPQTFADEQALLDLLRQIINRETEKEQKT